MTSSLFDRYAGWYLVGALILVALVNTWLGPS